MALSPVRKSFAAFSQEHRRFQDLMLFGAVSPLAQSDLQGFLEAQASLTAVVARGTEKMQARMPALPGG